MIFRLILKFVLISGFCNQKNESNIIRSTDPNTSDAIYTHEYF